MARLNDCKFNVDRVVDKIFNDLQTMHGTATQFYHQMKQFRDYIQSINDKAYERGYNDAMSVLDKNYDDNTNK
jgi:hypothetical protein